MEARILTDILIIILLILANGVFAGAEIAVIALRKTRLQELVESKRRGARAVLSLRERPERFFATVQIGITVVTATAAAFGGATFAVELSPLFSRIEWLAPYAHDIALAVVIALVSFLSIVVGELVPKSLALGGAETYALWIGKPILALSWLARPFVWILTASSNVLLKPFGDRTTFTGTRHSTEELQELVEEATNAGTLHPQAGAIASRALEFPELTAADVMVPRQEVILLPRRANAEEVRRILLEHTHTRMPVYEERVDNIVGYVSIKDILSLAWDPNLFVLEDLLRPAYFVPETQPAVDVLQEMRRRHVPFAIVVDEHGTMAGILTIEDLLEELVGEIFNEHVRQVPDLIKKDPDGTAIVSGAAPLREVNRALGLDLPEEGDWSTVAGLCLALTGRIPRKGDKVSVPRGPVLEVIDASPRRVLMVRVHPAPPLQPENRSAGAGGG